MLIWENKNCRVKLSSMLGNGIKIFLIKLKSKMSNFCNNVRIKNDNSANSMNLIKVKWNK